MVPRCTQSRDPHSGLPLRGAGKSSALVNSLLCCEVLPPQAGAVFIYLFQPVFHKLAMERMGAWASGTQRSLKKGQYPPR